MSERPKDFKGIYLELGTDTSTGRGSQMTARLIFGLVVLTLGALWTLDNLNIVESEPILRWWPAALVIFGLGKLTGMIPRRQPVMGTVFAVVGLILLGNEFEVLQLDVWRLWPLVMIAIGVSLVTRSMRGPAVKAEGSSGEDRNSVVHTFAMMAGVVLKNTSREFRGGDVSAIMGGAELDLRDARGAGPQVVLEVFAWMGGIDIFVPRDWRVVGEVTPIMAGYEDQTRAPEGEVQTTLIVRGVAIMGGIEVKN